MPPLTFGSTHFRPVNKWSVDKSNMNQASQSFSKRIYELFSAMRFAVSLLTGLGIASIIGTVLKYNITKKIISTPPAKKSVTAVNERLILVRQMGCHSRNRP